MQKIEITNTKDEVVDVIKREIIAGRLTSADSITQVDIAEKFGLSRMPIREAFNTLEQEGLLIKLNNRKLKVVEISTQTLTLYNELLSSLEFALLTTYFNNADYQSLLSKLSTIDAKSAVLEFHQTINEQTKDNYSKAAQQNLLNVFFAHSINYCTVDYTQAFSAIETLLTAFLDKQSEPLRVKSLLTQANKIIIDAIPL